jgi:hypothetical protein
MATYVVGFPAKRGPGRTKRVSSLRLGKKIACAYSKAHGGFVDVMRNGITVASCLRGRWIKGK